jgi:hypothetical protein
VKKVSLFNTVAGTWSPAEDLPLATIATESPIKGTGMKSIGLGSRFHRCCPKKKKNTTRKSMVRPFS